MQVSNFNSFLNRCPTIPHPECFKDTPAYELRRDPNQFEELRLVEKATRVPTYQMIQEAKGPSVKEIVNRAMLGDYSLIGQTKATFQDFTKAPRSLREVHDLIKDTSTNFNSLPTVFKEAFNNNVEFFKQSVIDGTVDSIVKQVVDKQVNKNKPVKEVNNEPKSE